MNAPSPIVLRHPIGESHDPALLAAEIDERLEDAAYLARQDLRDDFFPGISHPSEFVAARDLLDFLDSPEAGEPLRLTHNQLLVYRLIWETTWSEWVADARTTGKLASEAQSLQTTADEYATMQERYLEPTPIYRVLNRVVGPVPCLVSGGTLGGVWVPDRDTWDPYISGLRAAQEGQ